MGKELAAIPQGKRIILALSPEQGDESFLREVDENLRRDQMRDFAKAYGAWIVGGVLLFLAAVAGWLYWQERQRQKAEAATETLNQVMNDIGNGSTANAEPRLQALEDSSADAVRALARLTQAAVSLEKADRTNAIAQYKEVMAGDGLPQPYRDLATVRLTALEFDRLPPAQVIERLESLAKPGNPWFGSAGEMTAMAMLKLNRNAEAGRLFAAIAKDEQVPDTIRSRAVQIAGTLGVDATASLPGATQ